MAPRLTLALALLALSLAGMGCGGDDETATTAATGASGVDSATAAFDDADAKAAARTAQVALEVYATDNGSYAGADPAGLGEIEPNLADANLTVNADKAAYEIEVASPSGALFSITRTPDGAVELTCEPPGTAACPDNGDWG